jgi:hypothetical protein
MKTNFFKRFLMITILASHNIHIQANVVLNDKIKAYFQALESGVCDQTLALFTADAIVNSPLFGEMVASEFYKKLFANTNRSKVTLKEVFFSNTNATNATAHFVCDWVLKDGTPAPFECVDIFEFDPVSNKIQSLKIIYDTHSIRSLVTTTES